MIKDVDVEAVSTESFSFFGLLCEVGSMLPVATERPELKAWVEMKHMPIFPPEGLRVDTLERHRFDSQTFVPVAGEDYIAVVCPKTVDGAPDVSAARAFRIPGGTAMQYHRDVWHAHMSVVHGTGLMAVIMKRDFSDADCEFHSLNENAIAVWLNGHLPRGDKK
ncbi:ureidoglycolate lyase [Martelella sp. HB161492]|uniref:ureidoglycolate lyase n=1 Tax=Martelella sp. HB161492 TaxID=2720726 RepID=UPI0015929009|nr:ureidoglycolate lyase [Martelella sp. HB161492]